MALNQREILREEWPKFADASEYSDDLVDRFLDRAATEIDGPVWGAQYNKGVRALAAHNLELHARSDGGGTSAGTVSSKSVGPVSISFDVPDSDDPEAVRTSPGQKYARLKRKVAPKTAGYGRFTS